MHPTRPPTDPQKTLAGIEIVSNRSVGLVMGPYLLRRCQVPRIAAKSSVSKWRSCVDHTITIDCTSWHCWPSRRGLFVWLGIDFWCQRGRKAGRESENSTARLHDAEGLDNHLNSSATPNYLTCRGGIDICRRTSRDRRWRVKTGLVDTVSMVIAVSLGGQRYYIVLQFLSNQGAERADIAWALERLQNGHSLVLGLHQFGQRYYNCPVSCLPTIFLDFRETLRDSGPGLMILGPELEDDRWQSAGGGREYVVVFSEEERDWLLPDCAWRAWKCWRVPYRSAGSRQVPVRLRKESAGMPVDPKQLFTPSRGDCQLVDGIELMCWSQDNYIKDCCPQWQLSWWIPSGSQRAVFKQLHCPRLHLRLRLCFRSVYTMISYAFLCLRRDAGAAPKSVHSNRSMTIFFILLLDLFKLTLSAALWLSCFSRQLLRERSLLVPTIPLPFNAPLRDQCFHSVINIYLTT